MTPCHRQRRWSCLLSVFAVVSWAAILFVPTARAQTISNLRELSEAINTGHRTNRNVDLEAVVCAASRPKVGVVIVKDETGIELLQIGDFGHELSPGDVIRIQRAACLLRKREMGIQISGMPIVNNDGLHAVRPVMAETRLRAGRIPITLEWFNYWRTFALDVSWTVPNLPTQIIESARLSHATVNESGETNFLPGLRAECYEGSWEVIPDFNLLRPVKTGVVTNFDLSIRSREERIGVRFSGFLEVPRDGRYQFSTWSDDGSMVFLGDQAISVVRRAHAEVPKATPGGHLGTIINLEDRCWTRVEGRVSFVSQTGEGVQFDLGTDRHVISIKLADAAGLDHTALVNARVQVTGIGRGILTANHTLVLGKVFAASAKDLVFIEPALGQGELTLPITSVEQVQGLPIDRAQQAVPVRIRGTVTGAMKTSQEHWMSFQDDTRGIFVRLTAISNAAPAFGEMWEVEGHSEAGDFAPIVIADKVTRLGEGFLPPPVKPTWTELLNGSRDVQWVELKGLVTDVHTNTVSLRLPEGRLDVELEGRFESELKPFLRAVVKIRGVLYAAWDAETREVRVGRVMMRNPTLSVDVPAPPDPFDAVLKTPRELLLFDAQATAFRPVKVHGQIVYADSTQLFLEEDGTGLRLLPVERTDVRPGDMVEAVGYPDIGRTELLLREALLRKTGKAPLPQPLTPDETELSHQNLNSTRVRVVGKLLGWHVEQGVPVLEMQSSARLFLARIAVAQTSPLSLRSGSRLALEGVFVGRGRNEHFDVDSESFELLLNSFADVTVLSQPSWWTLPRLLALMGLLLVFLAVTVVWNTQLRRLVEQRTHQLQHEIRERERIERQHALEAERSRIARDLHDDLGSSLTEISVLASTGQLPQTSTETQPRLFNAISKKARSLISALDVIVWAVDPEDNSLQSLADYLSGYTDEFFSHTKIACRFKVPISFPSITLEGRVRHDLLMVVKETLNNIVRHSDATEVEFRMAIAGTGLEIDIADNGKGIDDEAHSQGHGLRNLSTRLQNLGGSCVVQSPAGAGTSVKIRLPLAAAAGANPGPAAGEQIRRLSDSTPTQPS
jgi:signal transduction histidine kinase